MEGSNILILARDSAFQAEKNLVGCFRGVSMNFHNRIKLLNTVLDNFQVIRLLEENIITKYMGHLKKKKNVTSRGWIFKAPSVEYKPQRCDVTASPTQLNRICNTGSFSAAAAGMKLCS